MAANAGFPSAATPSCHSAVDEHPMVPTLPFDQGCDDIQERYSALGRELGFAFDQDDADAARGYGCLLEFKNDRFWSSSYITDPAFIADRGYWSPMWDGVLALSPDFFEAYAGFSSVPWKTGTLEPKIRELVYVAVDAAATHMYEPGTRIHMENALKLGATPEEIMEVLALVSVLGVHTIAMGLPVLLDERKKAETRS